MHPNSPQNPGSILLNFGESDTVGTPLPYVLSGGVVSGTNEQDLYCESYTHGRIPTQVVFHLGTVFHLQVIQGAP